MEWNVYSKNFHLSRDKFKTMQSFKKLMQRFRLFDIRYDYFVLYNLISELMFDIQCFLDINLASSRDSSRLYGAHFFAVDLKKAFVYYGEKKKSDDH